MIEFLLVFSVALLAFALGWILGIAYGVKQEHRAQETRAQWVRRFNGGRR